MNWTEDCFARGATDACVGNRVQMGSYEPEELWIVDTWGSVLFSNLSADIGRFLPQDWRDGRPTIHRRWLRCAP